MFRARDHRGLDGDLKGEDDRRRTRSRAEAQRRTPLKRLSCLARNGREPRGRKSQQRRCGSADRGAAGLRPDRAIKEASCVRVLNLKPGEKLGEFRFLCTRGRNGSGRKRNNLREWAASSRQSGQAVRRVQPWQLCVPDRKSPARVRRFLRGPSASSALVSIIHRRGCLFCDLFDDKSAESSSLVCRGRENGAGRLSARPFRLDRAGLRDERQAREC